MDHEAHLSSPESARSEALAARDVRHPAHVDAPLILLESLLMMLIDRKVLAHRDAIDVLELSISTLRQTIAEDEQPERARFSVGVLSRIANSLAATCAARAISKSA